MTSLRLFSIALALGLITGCAYQTPIQRYSESKSKFHPPTEMMSNNYPDQDIYRLFVQGATGYVPVSACRSDAEDQANEFCQRQGKYMVLLGYKQSNPIPYPGNFPKAEIIFACVDKPGSSAPRRRVVQEPSAPELADPAPTPRRVSQDPSAQELANTAPTSAPVRPVAAQPKPTPAARPVAVRQKPAPAARTVVTKPAPSGGTIKQDASGTLYAQ